MAGLSGPAALLELARAAVPHVPLDKGVATATTGVLLKDCAPLLTLVPCVQTLVLYWRRGRRLDFVLFLLGFALAGIYHWLHMHPQGIASAHLLGLPGPMWRGLDIIMAQALLARTLGHAVGARTGILRFLSNLLFPASLLLYSHLLADSVLTLGFASKALVGVVAATLAAKAAVEGWSTVPKYCPERGRRTLFFFAAAFAFFPLPELFPRQYWAFHSLWHICLAEGYWLLISQLEGLPPPPPDSRVLLNTLPMKAPKQLPRMPRMRSPARLRLRRPSPAAAAEEEEKAL